MIPTDADLITACQDLYDGKAIFDHVDVGDDDGVYWGLRRFDGYDVIVLRGSVTPEDWFRDAQALTISTAGLGHVHTGFYLGMHHMWDDLEPMLEQPVIVTGHSLGAARASILTALMITDDLPPVARVVFGEPKPGLVDHAKIVNAVPSRSYRNGDEKHHDLVTDVPFSIPPLQYVHPTPVIPVCARPTGNLFESHGVFAWHHSFLYQSALAALQEKAA